MVMLSYAIEDKKIQYAYLTIEDFFECFDLPGAIKNADSFLIAASGDKIWKKSAPSRFVILKERLLDLSDAVFTIQESEMKREAAVIRDKKDPAGGKQKAGSCSKKNTPGWNAFTCNLSPRQFSDPYKAFKKFARHQSAEKWKIFFGDCLEAALSENSMDEFLPHYNMVLVRRRLTQMIEACYLIYQRSIENTGASMGKYQPAKAKK